MTQIVRRQHSVLRFVLLLKKQSEVSVRGRASCLLQAQGCSLSQCRHYWIRAEFPNEPLVHRKVFFLITLGGQKTQTFLWNMFYQFALLRIRDHNLQSLKRAVFTEVVLVEQVPAQHHRCLKIQSAERQQLRTCVVQRESSVQGVPKRKLYKELLITYWIFIIILHLVYHLKEEHIKIV